jgi:hypothetical protein
MGGVERSLKQLKEALQALEQLESALLEFEESISGEATPRPQEEGQGGVQLLYIPRLRQELGMEHKFLSWCGGGGSPFLRNHM